MSKIFALCNNESHLTKYGDVFWISTTDGSSYLLQLYSFCVSLPVALLAHRRREALKDFSVFPNYIYHNDPHRVHIKSSQFLVH